MNRVEIIVVINNIAPVVRRLAGTGNPINAVIVGQNNGRYAVNTNAPEIPENVYRFPQQQLMAVDAAGLPGVGAPGATAGFTPLLPYVPIPPVVNNFTGRYSLDLFPDGDTQIPTTYQLSDVTDISTVNSSFTKTISLPGSKRNQEAFGFISDLSADSTFNPNKRCRVYVEADSVVVLDGWIQLTKVVKNELKQLDKFECTIYADNANLWTSIGEATLEQIDLSELNHNRDLENIVASWGSSTSDGGYYYPLIDYGGWGTAQHLVFGADGTAFYATGDWTLKDLGGSTGSHFITPEMMYPSVYAKTIWDKVFQNIGYQYKSNFLNSSYFKNLIIPFNRSILRRAPSWETNKTFTIGLGVVNNGKSATMSYGTQSNNFYLQLAPGTTTPRFGAEFYGGIPGIGNLSATSAPGSGANNYVSAGIRIRFADTGVLYPYQNSFSSDPGHVFNPNSSSYSPYNRYNTGVFSATANDGWNGRMKIRFGVYYKIWMFGDSLQNNAHGGYGEVSVRRTRNINGATFTPVPFSSQGYNFMGYYSDVYNGTGKAIGAPSNSWQAIYSWSDFTGLIPNVNNEVKPIRFPYVPEANGFAINNTGIPLNIPGYGDQKVYNSGQSGVDPDSGLTGRLYEGEFYTAWLNGSNANQYPTWQGEDFYLEYKAGVNNYNPAGYAGMTLSKIDGKTAMWIEFMPDLGPGETVDMNQFLPASIKQRDYMMSLIKMFNLTIEPDKQVPNMMNIEPRDDYYAAGSVRDWTSKLDRNEDVEIQILGDIQNKTTIFKYKDDKDYYNEDYKSRHESTYGEFKFELDNDFIEGEKKVEVAFSPSPMVNVVGSRGFVMPKIVKASNGVFNKTDSNIRILRKTTSGTVSNIFGEVWRFGTTSSTAATYSYYPYAGHFDNPYVPTDDINFGQTIDLYYPDQTRATNQNLYTKYYYKQMNEYSDKDSRLLTGSFYLNPKDIYDFKFNDNIIIDNQYYRVVKIDGYDPTQRSTSKVTLIKALDITVPRARSTKVNISTPTGGLITAIGASRNTIMSQGSAAFGIGNAIPGNSDGTLIVGNGNRLDGDNPGTFISGNSNLVSEGAVSSIISGDTNRISSNSSANIFGNTNTILPNSFVNVFGDTNTIGVVQSVTVSEVSFINVFGNLNSVGTNVNAQVIGSGNSLNEAHALTEEVSTIFGYNNIIGTNSTATHILGSNNIVAESGTASNTTHILGNGNYIIPTSASTNDLSIIHIVGSDNMIHPSITPLNTVFGSRNILGTNSVGYIVGSDNIIAAAVTQSIVIGSNNMVDASSAAVFGDNNIVPDTTYNAKIFGNNITFASNVSNSTAIGRNINADESDKVYIADVVVSGGATGSGGPFSIVRGSYSTGTFSALLMSNISTGSGYEKLYLHRCFMTGGETMTLQAEKISGSYDSVNTTEVEIQGMIYSNNEVYYTKVLKVMNNGGVEIGTTDQIEKNTLTSGRSVSVVIQKGTGDFLEVKITTTDPSSLEWNFMVKIRKMCMDIPI